MKILASIACLVLFAWPTHQVTADEPVVVNLDVSEVPHLAEWGTNAKRDAL